MIFAGIGFRDKSREGRGSKIEVDSCKELTELSRIWECKCEEGWESRLHVNGSDREYGGLL